MIRNKISGKNNLTVKTVKKATQRKYVETKEKLNMQHGLLIPTKKDLEIIESEIKRLTHSRGLNPQFHKQQCSILKSPLFKQKSVRSPLQQGPSFNLKSPQKKPNDNKFMFQHSINNFQLSKVGTYQSTAPPSPMRKTVSNSNQSNISHESESEQKEQIINRLKTSNDISVPAMLIKLQNRQAIEDQDPVDFWDDSKDICLDNRLKLKTSQQCSLKARINLIAKDCPINRSIIGASDTWTEDKKTVEAIKNARKNIKTLKNSRRASFIGVQSKRSSTTTGFSVKDVYMPTRQEIKAACGTADVPSVVWKEPKQQHFSVNTKYFQPSKPTSLAIPRASDICLSQYAKFEKVAQKKAIRDKKSKTGLSSALVTVDSNTQDDDSYFDTQRSARSPSILSNCSKLKGVKHDSKMNMHTMQVLFNEELLSSNSVKGVSSVTESDNEEDKCTELFRTYQDHWVKESYKFKENSIVGTASNKRDIQSLRNTPTLLERQSFYQKTRDQEGRLTKLKQSQMETSKTPILSRKLLSAQSYESDDSDLEDRFLASTLPTGHNSKAKFQNGSIIEFNEQLKSTLSQFQKKRGGTAMASNRESNSIQMPKKRDDLRKRNDFFYQTLRGAEVKFSPMSSTTSTGCFITNSLSRTRRKMMQDVTKFKMIDSLPKKTEVEKTRKLKDLKREAYIHLKPDLRPDHVPIMPAHFLDDSSRKAKDFPPKFNQKDQQNKVVGKFRISVKNYRPIFEYLNDKITSAQNDQFL